MTDAPYGFANFSSLGILFGGMGAMVSERRPKIVAVGLTLDPLRDLRHLHQRRLHRHIVVNAGLSCGSAAGRGERSLFARIRRCYDRLVNKGSPRP
jgi:hypothetical protein